MTDNNHVGSHEIEVEISAECPLGIHGVVLSMIVTASATCLLSWCAYRRDLEGGSSAIPAVDL